MAKAIRVGIIGVSAESGWAKESHVPAVQKLAGLELAAVASKGQGKADAAAKAFGVTQAYADGADLIRDAEVDLVAVCVRVPEHRQLVLQAIAAGKHIYCEWPLGRNTLEAEEMASAAQTAGIHAAIGLQARANPAAIRARDLVASGAIGRPLSAHVYSSTAGFGPVVPAPFLYLEDPENGVNLVTIQGAHTIDFAVAILGGWLDLAALNTTQYPTIEAGEERKKQARSTFDHMLIQARIETGVPLCIEVAGGRPAKTPFRLEVLGEKGVLALDGGAARGFQSGRLSLSLNGSPQHVEEGEVAPMPDEAANVAGVYSALRDDILRGSRTAPDFSHAVRLSRVIDDVMASSQLGTRRAAAGWAGGSMSWQFPAEGQFYIAVPNGPPALSEGPRSVRLDREAATCFPQRDAVDQTHQWQTAKRRYRFLTCRRQAVARDDLTDAASRRARKRFTKKIALPLNSRNTWL